MGTKKFLIGGLVGGIVYFMLGYLFYGILFADFFHNHAGTATGVERAMDQFVWWALILGNILSGCLLSYVFIKSKVNSFGPGLITGGAIGLLTSSAYDFVMYGTTNLGTTTGLVGDIAVYTVMSAITGAIVGMVLGFIGKAK